MRKAVLPLVFLLALAGSFAGPPFVTDDPEPVALHNGEINVASQIVDTGGAVMGSAPHLEINYGLLPNLQTHVLFRLFFFTPSGTGRKAYGLGDIELGAKYRFVQESGVRPQIAFFPLLQIPTGDSSRGLGLGLPQLFVPLWLQKRCGPWIVYGGGGCFIYFPESAQNPDALLFGVAVQRTLCGPFILGAEIFTLTDQPGFGRDETAFNIGGVINFTDRDHVLLSAGRDITGLNRFTAYLAYQYTFGAEAQSHGTGGSAGPAGAH